MPAHSVLALDAGQSGIRTQLLHGDVVVDEQDFPGVLTDRPVIPQLAEVAGQALARAGQGAELLAVGSSGLTDEMTAEELLALGSRHGFVEVRLAHDSVTSYLGALGDRPGVAVAAGTGVVTLAVGHSEVARVDGWGYLLGDAGSGFWIGRAALDAVMRAHDGRGPATALTALAVEEFGDLEGAYVEIQSDERKVSRVAAWARRVAELAGSDEVCAQISRRAAEELATSALTGLRLVGQLEVDSPAVAMVGKVFNSVVLREHFEQQVRADLPTAQVLVADGSGIQGAARLAEVADDSALRPRIRLARRIP